MFEAFSRSGASLIRKSSIVAVVSFCVSSAASATVSVVDHPVGLADPLLKDNLDFFLYNVII